MSEETNPVAMSNKNKLENLFGEIQQSKWIAAARERRQNKSWLHYSQEIALTVLEQLDEQNLTQKALAEKMKVSPQLVNKWLKGSENFTLETIAKLEMVLGIRLINIGTNLALFSAPVAVSFSFTEQYEQPNRSTKISNRFTPAKVISMSQEVAYLPTAN